MMHLAERTVQLDKLGTIPDAMWWAVITLMTVGYGDLVPVTYIFGAALPSRNGRLLLPDALRTMLQSGAERAGDLSPISLSGPNGQRLQLALLGRIGDQEFLFRLTSDDAAEQATLLKQNFALTSREAEVLVWLARGKSNRDIAEILALSPRTVNKHSGADIHQARR